MGTFCDSHIFFQTVLRKAIFLALLLCMQCVTANAESQIDQVKAAYLLNFAKYVEWPEGDKSEEELFSFCIVGSDVQLPSYKALENKMLNDKKISVNLTEKAEEVLDCHVVLLSNSRGQEISKEVMKVTHGKPILVVSDVDEESMIYLFEEEGRIKFSVNLIKAQGSGLNFRSQMLQLATRVKN